MEQVCCLLQRLSCHIFEFSDLVSPLPSHHSSFSLVPQSSLISMYSVAALLLVNDSLKSQLHLLCSIFTLDPQEEIQTLMSSLVAKSYKGQLTEMIVKENHLWVASKHGHISELSKEVFKGTKFLGAGPDLQSCHLGPGIFKWLASLGGSNMSRHMFGKQQRSMSHSFPPWDSLSPFL